MAYWWKQIGIVFILVIVGLTAFLLFLLISGDRSWIVGVLATIVLLSIIVVSGSYYIFLKRALSRFTRMGKPEAILEVYDDRLKVTSDMGSNEINWSLISKVQLLKSALLLYLSENETMTLPLKGMSTDEKEFILSKIKANNIELL